MILSAAVLVFLLFAGPAFSQSYYEFLGPGSTCEIKYSPKYKIPYLDNGFDFPQKRGVKKARKRKAPTAVLEEIRMFPGDPDAIGRWIDEAYDAAKASFMKCGGRRADFAAQMTPQTLVGGVTVESTIWYEPLLGAILAGGYYPATRSIRVVNIYYGTTGNYRHARTLLIWEMKNHFAYLAGMVSEPTTPNWPCDAK